MGKAGLDLLWVHCITFHRHGALLHDLGGCAHAHPQTTSAAHAQTTVHMHTLKRPVPHTLCCRPPMRAWLRCRGGWQVPRMLPWASLRPS